MKVDEQVRTTVPLRSRSRPDLTHPVGACGTVVLELGDAACLVELRIPDKDLVGGAWYESFEMRNGELESLEPPR